MFVVMGSKWKKPVIDEDKLGFNLFLSGLEINVFRNKTGDKFRHESKEDVWTKADVEFESESYCKVFASANKRLNIVRLSPRAKDLLLWLIYEVENGKDYLWLNRDRYMEESGVGAMNTYRAALGELIGATFISKTNQTGVFWINPALFYNGNRIRKFKDNIV